MKCKTCSRTFVWPTYVARVRAGMPAEASCIPDTPSLWGKVWGKHMRSSDREERNDICKLVVQQYHCLIACDHLLLFVPIPRRRSQELSSQTVS